MYPEIILKPGKETSLTYHHPWIFSGAINKVDSRIKHGNLARIVDSQGKFIGIGTYSQTSSIAVRILDFSDVVINQDWFMTKIKAANSARLLLGYGPDTDTTGYRIVHAEADNLPGLIIDRYQDTIVFQISTAGQDQLRHLIISAIQTIFKPRAIVERSDLPVRKQEQLDDIVTCHFGQVGEPLLFSEYGINYLADVIGGQKTGFFLDQKDLRVKLPSFSAGKTILNLFSYTASLTTVALKSGAIHATNIDSSIPAHRMAEKNFQLNQLQPSSYTQITADVFSWLESARDTKFDMVIIDPPALIKSQSDIHSGKKAYYFLNRAALRLLKPGGIFITSSCSRFLAESDLAFILRQASIQSGINLRHLHTLYQSPDHPQSLYFPYSLYLKTLICQAEI